jgi:hypothetical protein
VFNHIHLLSEGRYEYGTVGNGTGFSDIRDIVRFLGAVVFCVSQVVTYVVLQVNLEEIKLVGQARLFSACRVNV